MTEKEEIIELYKVMVGTITSNEQRRQRTASVYMALIAIGGTALGALRATDPIYIVLPGLVISILWCASIRYFRRLAAAKFQVIADMEKQFAMAPFALEWDYFNKKKRKVDLGLAHLEMIVPATLAIASTVYIAYWAISHLC